jgi:tetratricopeptide (TPR) repeat protein
VLAFAACAADDLTDLEAGTPSIEHLEAILAQQLRQLPADDVRVLATRHALAGAYVVNLHMVDAIETFKGVIADRGRVLGRRHRDTLLARLHLSHAYGEDRPYRATWTLRGVVRDAVRALGPDDPLTLLSRYELATAYASWPRFPGLRTAGTLWQYGRLVDGLERVAGPAAPETLHMTGGLAQLLMLCGRRKSAIEVLIDVAGRAEREYGADDPITRSSIEDLAMAYRETGQPQRAIPLYERLLETQPQDAVLNWLAEARSEAAGG